jgi:hypothetical protein
MWWNFLHTHILFSDLGHTIFNMFIAFHRFLAIPQYVLENKNCEPQDDLKGRNMLFCKQTEGSCV